MQRRIDALKAPRLDNSGRKKKAEGGVLCFVNNTDAIRQLIECVTLQLIPKLDVSVPAAGGHLALLHRVPDGADGDLVVALELLEHLACLPVPEEGPALGVAREDVAAIGREGDLRGVACVEVSEEPLLLVELVAVDRRVAQDLEGRRGLSS